jgi:hypothetical protein
MQRNPSASNQLYRGEVQDFLSAMHLVQVMVQGELDFAKTYARDELDDRLCTSLYRYADAAKRCEAEYREKVQLVGLALAARWQKSEDEDVQRIGEALASGDYSPLAI